MTPGEATSWAHKDCGQTVVFDLSGGFCTGCHAENLEQDDLIPPADSLSTEPRADGTTDFYGNWRPAPGAGEVAS